MPQSIWKYPLEVIIDKQTVFMPAGAQILSVENQHGRLCIWAIVDTSADLEDREIIVMGTGGPVPLGELDHIGTAIMGSLVWHVAEMLIPSEVVVEVMTGRQRLGLPDNPLRPPSN